MIKLLIIVFLNSVVFAGVYNDIEAAKQASSINNKPILIFSYRDGCPYCEHLYTDFKNGKYRAIMKDYELAIIENSILLSKYNMQTMRTPTLFVTDSRLHQIARPIEGYPDKPQLVIDYLNKITKLLNSPKTSK